MHEESNFACTSSKNFTKVKLSLKVLMSISPFFPSTTCIYIYSIFYTYIPDIRNSSRTSNIITEIPYKHRAYLQWGVKNYIFCQRYIFLSRFAEIPASPILFYFPCFDKTQFCGDIEPQFFPGLVKNRAFIENWNLTEQEQVLVWLCLITVTFNNCLTTSIYSCFKDISSFDNLFLHAL